MTHNAVKSDHAPLGCCEVNASLCFLRHGTPVVGWVYSAPMRMQTRWTFVAELPAGLGGILGATGAEWSNHIHRIRVIRRDESSA